MNDKQYYTTPPQAPYAYYGYQPQPVYPQTTPPPAAPKRKFSGFESAMAWLSLLIGFLLCRVSPVGLHPFGGFLLVLAVYFTTFIVFAAKHIKLAPVAVIAGISGTLMAFPLIFTASEFVQNLSFGYSSIAYVYMLYAAVTGGKKLFSNRLLLELFKALFVLPFYSFISVFRAMFTGKVGFSGKIILKICIGIAVAVVPTAVILALLSYDAAFMELIRSIFDFTAYDVFLFVVDIIFAVPTAMYLFGLYASCSDGIDREILKADSCRTAFKKLQIAPAVTVFVAVVPVLFIYLIFFISQWKYYISGFTGDLPLALSYSGYAREGFFQLCIVSAINLLLVLITAVFAKRRQGRRSRVLTVTAILFSVCTLILIATAVSKMVLYINSYGLTPKRIWATWFMAFLFLAFVIMILSRFMKKVKVLALSLAVFAVMLAGIAILPVNRMIASYNVDRYLAGTIDELDYYSMTDLGTDGIPEFVRLAEELEKKGIDISTSDRFENRTEYDLNYYLTRQAYELEIKQKRQGILSFNLSEKAAVTALKNGGYMK